MESVYLQTLKAWNPPWNKYLSFVAQATFWCDLKNCYLVIILHE